MMCANLQLTDFDVDGRPALGDLAVYSAPLSDVLTMELDGAGAALGLTAEELLIAALGRAVQRCIGDGVVAVDVAGHGAALHPVSLSCAGPDDLSATDMLSGVHHAVAALSLYRAVHGVRSHGDAVADVLFALDKGDAGSAGMGHALELHAHRRDGVMVLDWWYDARSFEAYTVEEIAEQFPYALIELTSEASAPIVAGAELAMAY
ncbi:hypothetical protein [Mycolicibacterium sediminis]|uniref:Polyketide synthase n=1 Tax=Mycolicibacterium sediminis TaxID=1286180 RepID=A0A7I7QU47_9MYCO|nr:hypothetical protein [Mycolicibacterium sediminis]BBY29765.1 polyketide synthase [Mycolicibacterium sediminis]